MRQKLYRCMKLISFILLFIVLFVQVNQVLKRKALNGAWNMTIKTNGFYNEVENSIEVMGFGSSHMYCTVNPLILWQKANIPSYILTSQQQPACATYYYLKEALQTQKPSIVIIELYMFSMDPPPYEEGIYHDAIDYLKFSRNKINFIKEFVPNSDQKNYFFPFLKYHSRWENLEQSDFDRTYLLQTDWLKGYVLLEDSQPQSFDHDISMIDRRLPIPEENLYYLEKITELSREYGFDLVYMVSPYGVTAEQQAVYNSIMDYANLNNIYFLDYNKLFNTIGLNSSTDFYDGGHTNILGSEKINELSC